jgi:putative ABC transport system permease protein
MLRHCLSLALRHAGRNWLYAGITVLGLAAGFAAAILIGLYVRDEYSFEQFIAGYEDVYRLETDVLAPGQEPALGDASASTAAANLALDFPDIEAIARLARSSRWVGRDEADTWERVAWTDPDFFEVLPYPVLAGDPIAALHDPGGLVLTRKMARKYFGVDAPLGETLLVQAPDGRSSKISPAGPTSSSSRSSPRAAPHGPRWRSKINVPVPACPSGPT